MNKVVILQEYSSKVMRKKLNILQGQSYNLISWKLIQSHTFMRQTSAYHEK